MPRKSSMRRDDEIRLRHMLEAASEAVSFVWGRERSDLDADRQLVLGVGQGDRDRWGGGRPDHRQGTRGFAKYSVIADCRNAYSAGPRLF